MTLKKKIVRLVWFILFICLVYRVSPAASAEAAKAVAAGETKENRDERMKWWRQARFGMFIHWGLYAMPARHEWVKNRERITERGLPKVFRIIQS